MLAYAPLHHLLLGLPDDPHGPEVLVMTSGNVAGEPIVTGDAEARTGWPSSRTPGCPTTARSTSRATTP